MKERGENCFNDQLDSATELLWFENNKMVRGKRNWHELGRERECRKKSAKILLQEGNLDMEGREWKKQRRILVEIKLNMGIGLFNIWDRFRFPRTRECLGWKSNRANGNPARLPISSQDFMYFCLLAVGPEKKDQIGIHSLLLHANCLQLQLKVIHSLKNVSLLLLNFVNG